MRNEINNLKSERGNVTSPKKKSKSKTKGLLDYSENENYATYYKKNFNNEPRKVLSKRPLQGDSMQNQLKLRVVDGNFSEIDKLNALEEKLNEKNGLEEALKSETDGDYLSYPQSENENINSEMEAQFYGQSENQSPNQDTFKRSTSPPIKKNDIYWDIANEMDQNEIESQVKNMIPNLNMDKVHHQLS